VVTFPISSAGWVKMAFRLTLCCVLISVAFPTAALFVYMHFHVYENGYYSVLHDWDSVSRASAVWMGEVLFVWSICFLAAPQRYRCVLHGLLGVVVSLFAIHLENIVGFVAIK
jgi:hypothetical protein